MKVLEFVIIGLAVSSFIIAGASYPFMPDRMASHWNVEGDVDGTMPPLSGSLIFPVLSVFLCGLFLVIPRIDPLRKNVKEFLVQYHRFVVLIMLFFMSVQLQVTLWNLGVEISPNLVFPVGFGIMLFYAGTMMESSKRNYFIGIRTPWTLSDDRVWRGTHRVGGRLFKVCGVLSVAGFLFGVYSWLFIIAPVLTASVITIVYSYLLHRKLNPR